MERKQALEVMLRQRHSDADEHTDAADKHKQKLHCAKSHALEQEVGKTDDAVDTGLCEHAGDEHRDGGRSRAVRIRRQRMGEEGGVEVNADASCLGKIDPFFEVLGLYCVPVRLFAVEYGIAGVQIELLFAGYQLECLIDISHKLVGRPCLAGVIAGGLNAA